MFQACLEPGPQTCPGLSRGPPPFRHGWTLIPASSHQSLHRLPLPSHPFFSVHLSVFYRPVSKPSFPDCLQAAARLLVPGLPLSPSPGRLVPSLRCHLARGYQGKKSGACDLGTDGNEGETRRDAATYSGSFTFLLDLLCKPLPCSECEAGEGSRARARSVGGVLVSSLRSLRRRGKSDSGPAPPLWLSY